MLYGVRTVLCGAVISGEGIWWSASPRAQARADDDIPRASQLAGSGRACGTNGLARVRPVLCRTVVPCLGGSLSDLLRTGC